MATYEAVDTMKIALTKFILLAASSGLSLVQLNGIAETTATDYLNRAAAKVAKGDLDDALTDVNRAIELDPKSAVAYNGRGVIKKKKGDLDGAIADYNRAIQANPRYALPYYNRGLVEDAKGDVDSAIADYNRAIELDPKYVKRVRPARRCQAKKRRSGRCACRSQPGD